ncbi:MAG TPA: dihydrolipoamide acetyltransferase family protein [Thermodesulfovibrionales bacterium]|nr:dihydrolipoamide acetyltransferase family protein [Thermodesulfovibrionales bacterium]
MPFDFKLPDLGEGITEGEIRKWIVKEGDSIEEHQTVLEIETDKAVVEVPSPKKGKILKMNKEEGDIAKVGEVLMTIAEEGEAIEEKPKAEEAPAVEERPKSVSVVGVLPEEEEGILATPAVRSLAKELGVNLETIKGSGPGGSITKEDVTKVSEKVKKTAEDLYGLSERVPLKGLRRTIAKNLLTAHQTMVFVTIMDEADVTDLWNIRDREKKVLQEKGIHLTFLPFFMKALQHSLVEHPYLNASVDGEKEEIILKKYFNIGIAVDTPDGLMVPVIKDVDKKTVRELASEIQDLSQKAKERKIKLEEMRGSSFTISNWGHFGGTFATPVINYPDAAILGTGRISDKPWVKEGQIVIRKILPLSLTFDHRVTDGADAATFLSKVMRYLEDPGLLFIESA